MSDQGPRMINVGGVMYGDTPEPPEHLRDVDSAAADAAWRQSNGSIAAYHQLLEEHKAGTINLTGDNPMRITPEDYEPPFAGPGDPRLTDTGGAVYGGEGGTFNPIPPGGGPAPEATAEHVTPLSESEREMLADLRGKPEAELTASEAANLRALSDREEALATEAKPLTRREQRRLAELRGMPEADRSADESAELSALETREGVER